MRVSCECSAKIHRSQWAFRRVFIFIPHATTASSQFHATSRSPVSFDHIPKDTTSISPPVSFDRLYFSSCYMLRPDHLIATFSSAHTTSRSPPQSHVLFTNRTPKVPSIYPQSRKTKQSISKVSFPGFPS